MTNLLKNYGLSLALFAMFVVSWSLHGIYEWKTYVSEQEDHNQEVQLQGYMDSFWQSTFENWQSEFLQLFTMVVLTSFLSHKGSPESKDSQEKTEKLLFEIRKELKKA